MSAAFAKFHPNVVVGGTYSGQIVLWDNRSNKRTPVQRTPLSAAAHTVQRATDSVYSHYIVLGQRIEIPASSPASGLLRQCGRHTERPQLDQHLHWWQDVLLESGHALTASGTTHTGSVTPHLNEQMRIKGWRLKFNYRVKESSQVQLSFYCLCAFCLKFYTFPVPPVHVKCQTFWPDSCFHRPVRYFPRLEQFIFHFQGN